MASSTSSCKTRNNLNHQATPHGPNLSQDRKPPIKTKQPSPAHHNPKLICNTQRQGSTASFSPCTKTLIPCVLHHPSCAQPKPAMQSVHAAMLNSPSTRRHCFLRRRCNQTASLPVACSPSTQGAASPQTRASVPAVVPSSSLLSRQQLLAASIE